MNPNDSGPLSSDELDWLDVFILSRFDPDAEDTGKDEGIYCVSSLDGFLTAVICGPDLLPPSEWLPLLWGEFPPQWETREEAELVMSLLIRHMNSIALILMEFPQDYEALFMERTADERVYTLVDEWCEGFMRVVDQAPGKWRETEVARLLLPIEAFSGERAKRTHNQLSHEQIEALQQTIEPNIRDLHAYYLKHRDERDEMGIVRHRSAKVGRNDPCPCGSGKKYKKCCLH